MKLIDKLYDFKVVRKPWGYEYVAYRNANKLALTFLKINFGKQTSFHCHPIKKTGFILLQGKAEIKLGFDSLSPKIYEAPEKIMIRPGLFHYIKSVSKQGITALEFESPVMKNDLVRYHDKYGRQSKPYESSNYFIDNKDVIEFKTPKLNKELKYEVGKNKIIIKTYSDFKTISKINKNKIVGVLNGAIIDDKSRKVLSEGDIVRISTLKSLMKRFKIKKKKITLLQIN